MNIRNSHAFCAAMRKYMYKAVLWNCKCIENLITLFPMGMLGFAAGIVSRIYSCANVHIFNYCHLFISCKSWLCMWLMNQNLNEVFLVLLLLIETLTCPQVPLEEGDKWTLLIQSVTLFTLAGFHRGRGKWYYEHNHEVASYLLL